MQRPSTAFLTMMRSEVESARDARRRDAGPDRVLCQNKARRASPRQRPPTRWLELHDSSTQLRAKHWIASSIAHHTSPVMRWLAAALWLGLLGIAQALSATGSRVLVIVEEADKSKYSTFWDDIEGEPS